MQNIPVFKLRFVTSARASQFVCWSVTAFGVIAFSFDVRANRVDRIDPSAPGFTDEYFLQANPGSPNATLTETGIDRRATFLGRRDVLLDLNGGTSAYSVKQYADSFLELNNDADTSAILTLDYGADNFSRRPTINPFNAIAVTVSEVSLGDDGLSLGSGRFTLTLRSGTTTATSLNGIDFNQPGTYYLSYSDPGFAGIQFNHLNEVAVNLLTTTAGSDFRIGSIYRVSIPEPSSWLLFGLGGVGLLAAASWHCKARASRFPA